MNVLPTAGGYRMDVWPRHVAWSTLGVQTKPPFKLETAFSLTAETPGGYGGLLGRYQDPANFYFFVVDGQGRFQAQLLKAGVLYPLQPWIALNVVNPPGENNVMALADDGAVMHLYLNDALVFEVVKPEWSTGQTGVIAGAGDRSPSKINVDWLKVYDAAQ